MLFVINPIASAVKAMLDTYKEIKDTGSAKVVIGLEELFSLTSSSQWIELVKKYTPAPKK